MNTDFNTDTVTASDLLDMCPEQIHALVEGGQISMDAFCDWFKAMTVDSHTDGYASGWQDGHSDGYDAGQYDGYDRGYEDGNRDCAGDGELEIDETTGMVK